MAYLTMRSEIVCKPKRQTTSKGRAMQMNGFLDRRVLNVRRPLKYIIITEVVCRHPLLRHTRRRFYPPSTGGCVTILYHTAQCSARHFGGRGKRRGRCGSPALPHLGAQGAGGGARRGTAAFFRGRKKRADFADGGCTVDGDCRPWCGRLATHRPGRLLTAA